MTSTYKEYLVPLDNAEAKTEIRQWLGQHNGMSILKTDWCYSDDKSRHWITDAYLIKITNPKTELLFCLSYPDAKDITGMNKEDNDWRFLE